MITRDPSSATVSIVIPTLNAMDHLPLLIPSLLAQIPKPPVEILLIDSESDDGTSAYASSLGAPVRLIGISRSSFSHGGTRNLGTGHAVGDIIVFMSQDALPLDTSWLAALLKPFRDPRTGAVFSRQVPRPDANPMEQFFLRTHFPPTSRTFISDKDRSDVVFQRDVFFSNVSSAAPRSLLLDHPFDETLVMSEDQQFARDLLFAGYTLAYAADSVVQHSHNYTWRQAVRRYFDSAYSLSQVFAGHGFSASARLGTRYTRQESREILRHHPLMLPRYAWYVLGKALGTFLGHHARLIPRPLARRISQNPAYWTVRGAIR